MQYYYERGELGGLKLGLVVIPDVSDTLTLQVYRYPLTDMVIDADTPEIDEQFHIDLLPWVRGRILSRSTDDVLRTQAPSVFRIFEQRFGRKPSAKFKRMRRQVPVGASIYMRDFV